MARQYDDQWPAYVPVAERRLQAERAIARLSKQGTVLSPVTVAGRRIVSTFWGRAWCDNLQSYRDYAHRLERGRSYVRNGLVIDLQVGPHTVRAMVSGSSLYAVKISIKAMPTAQWKSICADCAGGIDSLVELLQGRFANGVMERICRQGGGLFPQPAEISFACNCLDHASMCKHVAAALLSVGARLDAKPELLFRLRGVNQNDLLADIGLALPMTRKGPAAGKVLQADDVAALFGLDMGDQEAPAETAVPLVQAPTVLTAATSAPKPATGKSPPAKHQLAAKKPAPRTTAGRVKPPQSGKMARATRG